MSLAWEHAGQLPTIPPPPGVVSNFDSPVSLHIYNDITQGICLSLTTILVAVRLWTKGYILRRLGWDDLTCVLGWLGYIAYAIVLLEADKFGNGRHLWDVKGDDFTQYMKIINVTQILYCPVAYLIKVSIVLLFLRIFAPRRYICVLLHIVLWSNLIFYTTGVFLEIWQCKPREKIWLPLIPGKCINQQTVQLVSCIFNTVSDFAMLTIPMLSVWDLHLPPKKKLGLVAIFGTGALACIASVARMIFLVRRMRQITPDGTWIWYPLNLCSTAELTCGIICGCLPPLPAFFRYLSGKPPLTQAAITSMSQFSSLKPVSIALPMRSMQTRTKDKDERWVGMAAVC